MADELGMLTLDFIGSLQMQNLEAILSFIETTADPADTENVILCGDFNSFFGSRTVRRLLTHFGNWGPFVDCARATGNPQNTHHYPLRIDYIFLSSRSKTMYPVAASSDSACRCGREKWYCIYSLLFAGSPITTL